MKPILFSFLVVLLFSCSEKKPEKVDHESTLKTSIEKFNQAFATADIEKLEGLITEDYQHTNGTSEAIGRSSWLSYLGKRKSALESGELVVHSYDMDDLKIQHLGGSAIATAKVMVSQTRDSVKEERAYRVTTVWILEDGIWKRAGFHDGAIQ
ncbi:MAG: nuclear transport factor 2 family protein [Bacteroidota bacterium]